MDKKLVKSEPEKRAEIVPVKPDSARVPGTVEKILANPTLVIAGLAAIPLLFVAWGVTRRWRKKRETEEDYE